MTTRPNRLTITVCDPGSLKPNLDETDLISAREKIFEAVKFSSFLTTCHSKASDLKSFRDNVVVELQRIRKAGMAEIEESFTPLLEILNLDISNDVQSKKAFIKAALVK